MLMPFRRAVVVLAAIPVVVTATAAEAVAAGAEIPGPEATPTLDVSPQQMPSDEFAGDVPVHITVSDLYPDEEVRLDISTASPDVDDFQQTKTVDDDGTVTFTFSAVTGSDPNRFAGSYRVQVVSICGDRTERARETFRVAPVVPRSDGLELEGSPK